MNTDNTMTRNPDNWAPGVRIECKPVRTLEQVTEEIEARRARQKEQDMTDAAQARCTPHTPDIKPGIAPDGERNRYPAPVVNYCTGSPAIRLASASAPTTSDTPATVDRPKHIAVI